MRPAHRTTRSADQNSMGAEDRGSAPRPCSSLGAANQLASRKPAPPARSAAATAPAAVRKALGANGSPDAACRSNAQKHSHTSSTIFDDLDYPPARLL